MIALDPNKPHDPTSCKKCEFIIDIHFDGDVTHIWSKTVDGKTKHYPIHYHPRIYIAQALQETIYQYNHEDLQEIAKTVAKHPDVISIRMIDCYLNSKSDEITKAIEVELYSIRVMSRVVEDFKKKNYYLYNIDINKRQHFFLDTYSYPLGACHINLQKTHNQLYYQFEPIHSRGELYRNDYQPIMGTVELLLDTPITMYDDISKIDYFIPTLRILKIEPIINKQGAFNTYDDELGGLNLLYGHYVDSEIQVVEELNIENKPNSREITESQILLQMVDYIQSHDIDILLIPGGDKFTLNYLAHRAKHNDIADRLILGRLQKAHYARKDRKNQVYMTYGQILNKSAASYLPGRIHLDYDNSFILYEGELAGVIDLTRMSATPIERTARASIGTTLTGIEFVISQTTIPKTLVPENKVGGEQFKDADVLLIADNGGLTYPAVAGVYDKVWAIDYTSLYPMIMMKHNIGSETVLCEHEECRDKNIVPELGYHVCAKRISVVTRTMKLILSKRVAMKHLKRTLKNDKRVERYKGMDSALKWILVCCFEGSTRVLVRKNGEYLSERLDTIVNEFTDTDKLEAFGMDEEGRPEFKPVKSVIKIRPQTPVFRIKFQGGETVVATADHLWPTKTNNGWQNVRTDQLTKDHLIPQLEQFRDLSNKLSDTEIQRLERLKMLAEAPLHFTRAIKVIQLEKSPDYVYCLELDSPNPWFMIQGSIITHNCFGYLGFKNSRWGSIESHQCVTSYGRRYLLQARLIVEEFGFKVIAGLTDSLFIQAVDPSVNNQKTVNRLAYTISRETGIPMDIEGMFNWVVFCNVKNYSEVAALNRYFGYFNHGELKLRGIRTRQRSVTGLEDTFQREILDVLATATTLDGFEEKIIQAAKILLRWKEQLRNRDVDARDLVFKIKSHVGSGNYKSRTQQAIAAQSYVDEGRQIEQGQSIFYLVRDDRCRDSRRVTIGPRVDKKSMFDIEWYCKVLDNAFLELLEAPQKQLLGRIKYGKTDSYEDLLDWLEIET